MKLRLTSFALLFALMSAFMLIPASSVAAKPGKGNGNPLKGVKAHAKLGDATLSVTEFAVNSTGQLVASGTVTSPTRGQLATFSNVAATIVPQQEGEECPVLFLRLAPIFLDLLGLVVQTTTITVEITAVPGEGALLGNLLCTLAGLLDPEPVPAAMVPVLNQILAALGGGLTSGSPLTGALPISITGFASVNQQLVARFFVNGPNGTQVGPFVTPAQVIAPPEGTCEVLTLTLGPIDINLLGLRIQLYGDTEADPVTVLIYAVPGEGNLLGNLLCGITRLLDGQPNLTEAQRLTLIARILNRILGLLG